MKTTPPDITPVLTIDALLNAYPQLEDVLIDFAPPFKKLKNPILRKSVAKVATIKHAASVARVPVDQLISTLRQAVGQAPAEQSYSDENYFPDQPNWFDPEKITTTLDEAKLDNPDQMTLVPLLQAAKKLQPHQIVQLTTTFIPAPGIDLMKANGYAAWSQQLDGGIVHSYFTKLNS